MNILRRLIKQKEQENQIVWGIRVPLKVRIRWQVLAAILRVPTNRLILHVLNDWAKANSDILLDEPGRNRLADKITEAYLNNKPD